MFEGNNEMPLKLILFLSFLGGLIGVGTLVIIFKAMRYIQNKYHTRIVSYRHLYAEKVPIWIMFKLETFDAFAAFNPINVFGSNWSM